MSDITALDNDLNQKVLTGAAMDAFELYYADDVIMQENSDPPFEGKDTEPSTRDRILRFRRRMA